jgi:hypothetical protein
LSRVWARSRSPSDRVATPWAVQRSRDSSLIAVLAIHGESLLEVNRSTLGLAHVIEQDPKPPQRLSTIDGGAVGRCGEALLQPPLTLSRMSSEPPETPEGSRKGECLIRCGSDRPLKRGSELVDFLLESRQDLQVVGTLEAWPQRVRAINPMTKVRLMCRDSMTGRFQRVRRELVNRA